MRRNAKRNAKSPESSEELAYRQFLALVRQWNSVGKLVSTHDLDVLEARHLQDSLSLLPNFNVTGRYLDVGAGGGFPGIPIAIARPELSVVLLERNQRKCSFLRHVCMKLKLTNVSVHSQDVRELDGHIGSFDHITARAVAAPAVVWRWVCDLLQPAGRVVLQCAEPLIQPPAGSKVLLSKPGTIGHIVVLGHQDDSD